MDDLFIVYRYLVLNRHRTNDDNPYNAAFRAFDSYVDMEREIAYYAGKISSMGGLDFEDAEKLTERLLTGFETGLNNHHGTTLATAIDFVKKYISLDDIGKLIEACHEEKARMIREDDDESAARDEALHFYRLDSSEGIEEQ
jgi:cobyrinic acid a,c-diamide synthase